MRTVLERVGFDTTTLSGREATLANVNAELKRVQTLLVTRPRATVLFYFTGHGAESNGINELELEDSEEIRVQSDVLKPLAGAQIRIVILDCCRTQLPTPQQPPNNFVLRPAMMTSHGTFIAYSCALEKASYQGVTILSEFTNVLVRHIDAPELEITKLFRIVRAAMPITLEDVSEQGPDFIDKKKEEKNRTGDSESKPARQNTWDYSSLIASFYFVNDRFVEYSEK